jgi:hypothetical protein
VKRIAWIVLGAALAGPGCLNLTTLPKEAAPPPPTAAAAAPAPAPPAVVPEQVNDKNAWDKAKALGVEIAHDIATAQPADGD